MASAHPKKSADLNSAQLTDEFLQCPLCFDQFKQPRVLPCQHTFCLHCLRQYVAARGLASTIPCPMCKEITTIPDNDVSQFKSNFMIVSLLHFVESSVPVPTDDTSRDQVSRKVYNASEEGRGQQCEACNEVGLLEQFCPTCEMWLCPFCTTAHRKVPSTSFHRLLTNAEVNKQCRAMAIVGEETLMNLKQGNTEKLDCLTVNLQKFPSDIDIVKERIKSAAQEAQRVISEKTNDLLEKLANFNDEYRLSLTSKCQSFKEKNESIDDMLQILNMVKESSTSGTGKDNKERIKRVEDFLSNGETDPVGEEEITSVSFIAFNNNLSDLKNMDMGYLQVVSEKMSTCYLTDRPLGIHKVASLVEREYISGLAISRFADKFVVANNNSVFVFKPDSRIPKHFLSPLSERQVVKPWGIAFSEDDRRVFISEAGRYQGDGGVISYSRDGTFHSIITSGLTLPRGIAVYKSYIFVCDQIDKCVYILNIWGKIIKVLKKTPDDKYLFVAPMFISVGKNGTFAVSDNRYCVKIFDKDCRLLYTYISKMPDSELWDVIILQDGTVVVCDWKHGLHKISPDFSNNGVIETGTNSLKEPSAVAILENGNSVYIGTCGGDIYSAI